MEILEKENFHFRILSGSLVWERWGSSLCDEVCLGDPNISLTEERPRIVRRWSQQRNPLHKLCPRREEDGETVFTMLFRPLFVFLFLRGQRLLYLELKF